MALKDKSRRLRCVYSEIDNAGITTNFGRNHVLVRTTDGSSNPSWRNTIAQGLDATGILDAKYDQFINAPGNQAIVHYSVPQPATDKSVKTASWHGYRAGHECNPPSAYDGTLVSIASTRALVNFNKKLRNFSNAMQGGVFLGELREAAGMLRRPAASLFEGLGKYLDTVNQRSRVYKAKRGRRRVRDKTRIDEKLADQESIKHITKIAAETWLEYSFGWIPFVSDIEDAFTALDNLRSEERTVNVSAGGQAESTGSVGQDYPTVFGVMGHVRSASLTYRCHVRIKGALRIQPQTTYVDHLKNWGVHTSQWVPIIWELVPWSFLVDYFTNIGDILNADNTLNSRLVWCARGVKQTATQKVAWSPDHARTKALLGSKYISSSGSTSFASYERSSISRAHYAPSDLTLSDISVSLPDSGNQWLNMAALLASANSIHAQRFNRF